MLLLDLGVFNKKSHEVSTKEALVWSIVWITLAILFGGYIWYDSGIERASQFYTAYGIEKLLSVDNLFVFILVFGFFKVPKEYQHRVLFWGVIGALVLRAVFIYTGVQLIQWTYLPEFTLLGLTIKINLLLFLFGLFLVYAGIKSMFMDDEDDEDQDFSKSAGARFIRWIFPRVTDTYHGDKFWVKIKGLTYATPLLIVLGVIEFTDLLFAVDSIPAIFTIAPDDPFILYSSNIFAILGLRSLYFLLANFIDKFKYLKYGIAVILVFIGTKMLIAPVYHIDSVVSLGVLVGVLFITTFVSIFKQ